MLCWGVLPRAVFWFLAGRRADAEWNKLQPDWGEQYFDDVEDACRQEESRKPQDGDNGGGPAKGQGSDGENGEKHKPISRPSHDEGSDVVLSYGIAPPTAGWTYLVDRRERPKDLGNVSDPRAKVQADEWFEMNTGKVDRLVVVFDINTVPVGEIIKLYEKYAEFASQRFVVLSCGNRLRENLDNNQAQIDDQFQLWRRALQGSQASPNHVIDIYDHELNESRARETAVQLMFGEEVTTIGIAGKFRDAKRKICESVRRLEARVDGTTIDSEMRWIENELDVLYRNQDASLLKRMGLNKLAESHGGEVIENIQGTLSETSEYVGQKISEGKDALKERARFVGHLYRLSPGYAVGGFLIGGIGGILAGVAVGPILIAGLFAAVAAAHLPMAAEELAKRFRTDPTPAEDLTSYDSQPLISFDSLVRPATKVALVMELQGREESKIAEGLETICSRATNEPIVSVEDTETYLESVHAGLRELAEREGN